MGGEEGVELGPELLLVDVVVEVVEVEGGRGRGGHWREKRQGRFPRVMEG